MANEYDKVQWNLYFLLKASMIIYIMLLALAFVTTRARRLILGLYYVYSWSAGDCTFYPTLLPVSALLLTTFFSSSFNRNEHQLRNPHG